MPRCPGRQYGHGHGGTGPLTARASAGVSGKCDFKFRVRLGATGWCSCRAGPGVTAAAAAADSVAGAEGCSLSSRRRPGIMMGHRDSYNFELALKLEVDPAARRPDVTVTPVTGLQLTESVPVPGSTVAVTGTGPLTARASAWVSGKCDLDKTCYV